MSLSKLSYVTLKSGAFEVCPEGYLLVRMSDYAVVDLEEAKEREKVFLTLCKDNPMPFVVITKSKLIEYTDEAREYMANNSRMDEIRLAEAFVSTNIGVQLFIENYLKKNPNKCPSKIFKDKEEAIEWVKQFIK